MKKRKISKKGIDEKVATILLVAFIIALLIMGFLWGKQLIKQRVSKETALSEKKFQCPDLAITVKEAVRTMNTVLITVENQKDAKIEKLTFGIVSDGKTVPIESFDVLNGLELKKYEINIEATGISNAENIDVIPWIKVAKGNFVPCSEQHVLARITEIS